MVVGWHRVSMRTHTFVIPKLPLPSSVDILLCEQNSRDLGQFFFLGWADFCRVETDRSQSLFSYTMILV